MTTASNEPTIRSPVEYVPPPRRTVTLRDSELASFIELDSENIDWGTVHSFGEEWSKFSHFSDAELSQVGKDYFDIVDDSMLNEKSLALDMGCGTGRWTRYISQRCHFVEAIDPSKAVIAASKLLSECRNVRITQADVDKIPFPDESFDFVFSLGVLHHIPDTQAAMRKCVEKLKPGGHFLVYLYYNLDNMGTASRVTFAFMNAIRRLVCKLPATLKKLVCDFLAVTIYFPNAIATWFLKWTIGGKFYEKVPLAYYHDKSFNVMRNDALDRFGTPLEQRFSKVEIIAMMESCGLSNIVVSPNRPYWHAVGKKEDA